MAESLIECRFFIPLVRDGNRNVHAPRAWQRLNAVLYATFRASTTRKTLWISIDALSGEYHGKQGRVVDESREYILAIPRDRLDELRRILRRACITFDQQCLYFSVQGLVEFPEATDQEEAL